MNIELNKSVSEFISKQSNALQNLTNETINMLINEVERLQNAIRKHRDAKGHEACSLNDDELYSLLPEHKGAVRELPPESELYGFTTDEFIKNCQKYYNEQKVKP